MRSSGGGWRAARARKRAGAQAAGRAARQIHLERAHSAVLEEALRTAQARLEEERAAREVAEARVRELEGGAGR